MSSVHRSLVLALGDAQCTRELGDAEGLEAVSWAAGIERTRVARFAAWPRWQGSARVGFETAQRFLRSDESRLLLETVRLLPLQRAFDSVVVPIAERLRKPLEVDFVPNAAGGVVIVRGALVLSAAVWAGFFEGLVAEIRGRWSVALKSLGAQRIELLIAAY